MSDPFAPITGIGGGVQPPKPPPIITPPAPSVGGSAPSAPSPMGGAPSPFGGSTAPVVEDSGPLAELGKSLFGQGNGSLLGGIPVIGDIGRGLGEGFKSSIAGAISPITAAAGVISHIPTGFATGTDSMFDSVGEQFKQNGNEQGFADWLAVRTKANSDILDGGNQKANYLAELMQQSDDAQHGATGLGGILPTSRIGLAAGGSLGGILSNGLMSTLGVQEALVQRAIAGSQAGSVLDNPLATFTGLLDVAGNAFSDDGKKLDSIKKLVNTAGFGKNRLQELQAQNAQDPKLLGDVEKFVVDNVNSGKWDEAHGLDYLVGHNQGYSDDFLIQLYGTMVTDPLNVETMGAGSIAKAARGADVVATRIASAKSFLASGAAASADVEAVNAARAAATASAYEKMGLVSRAVQSNKLLGGAAKIARGLIDPFSLMPHGSATRGALDLTGDNAAASFSNAFHEGTEQELYGLARKHDFVDALQSDIGAYSADQFRLMAATDARDTAMHATLGESLIHYTPDEAADIMTKAAPRDLNQRLADFMFKKSKNGFNATETEQLANRMSQQYGMTFREASDFLASASDQTKSALHALTYKSADREFMLAKAAIDRSTYLGDVPVDRLVLANDANLTDVAVGEILADVKAAPSATDKANVWNAAVRKYPAMADLGVTSGAKGELGLLTKSLKKMPVYRVVTPIELAHPSLAPLKNMLDTKVVGAGERTWNIAFRPTEETAWGLTRHPVSGNFIRTHDVTISHVVDALPAASPFSNTTHNVLGHIIGTKGANALNRPIESMEAFFKAGRAQFSGARLVEDVGRRFELSATTELGLSKQQARELFAGARTIAGLDQTTIKGLAPKSLAELTAGIVPEELKTVVTPYAVLDHLLNAANGDIRVVGVGTKFAQGIRNALRNVGVDGANASGQITVGLYNKMRYAFNPAFLIQRVTDGPYFALLAGVMPVGGHVTAEGKVALQAVMENIGRTSLGRDAAMDLSEYTLHSQFADTMYGIISKKAGVAAKLESLRNIPDSIVRANQINLMYADMGMSLREAFDEMPTVISRIGETDPELAAKMTAQFESTFGKKYADLHVHFEQQAGRKLTENEVGTQFLNEMFASSTRRVQDAKTGVIDVQRLIHEGDMMKGHDIGEVRVINQTAVAHELGFVDDSVGTAESKMRQMFQHDGVQVFRERLTTLGATPDYTERLIKTMQFNWDTFMGDLRHSLNLPGPLVTRVENTLAEMARVRGVTPAEYVTQIMSTNISAKSMKSSVGELVAALKTVKSGTGGGIDEFSRIFAQHLDPSSQRTLLDHWLSELEGKDGTIAAARLAGDKAQATALQDIANVFHEGPIDSNIPLDINHPDVFTAAHPMSPQDIKLKTTSPTGRPVEITRHIEGTFGSGVYEQPEELQRSITTMENERRRLFPMLTDRHVDVVDLPKELLQPDYVPAVTDPTTGALFLDKSHMSDTGQFNLAVAHAHEAATGGVSHLVGTTPEDIMAHELYHDVDRLIKKGSFTDKWRERYLGDLKGGTADIPEGFTANPFEVGQGETFSPELHRDGIFHISTNSGGEGFGSKGDVLNQGRVSTLLDRARTQTYLDRLTIAADAAHGASTDHIMDAFTDAYTRGFGSDAEAAAVMERHAGAPLAEWATKFTTPEEKYALAQRLDGGLTGKDVTIQDRAVKLSASFEDAAKWDPAKFEVKQYAARKGASAQRGLDTASGELTFARDDLHQITDRAPLTPPSKYGGHVHPTTGADNADEAMAELTSLAFSPNADPALVSKFRTQIEGYKAALVQDRILYPDNVAKEVKLGHVIDTLSPESSAFPSNDFDAAFGDMMKDLIVKRARGKTIQNPEAEGAARYFSKWMQDAVYKREGAAATKLRGILDAIPTANAQPFNHAQALMENLMRQKMGLMERDAYMLTEMSTNRSGFMRSINHPFFGMYPASYMWGKVIPQTFRFLSKNPYALTNNILDVERQVAIQREFDDRFANADATLDKSEVAFVAGYLTPSLPWEAMSAHTPPWLQTALKGKHGPDAAAMLNGEFNTISPSRWYSTFGGAFNDIVKFGQSAAQPQAPAPTQFPGLDAGGGTQPQPSAQPQGAVPASSLTVTGHIPATGLQPILSYDMDQLSKIFGH